MSPALPLPNLQTWRLRGHFDGCEHTFDITEGEYRIGSSQRSDVRLSGAGVSREHALLQVTHRGIVVVDRGSKNGTFADGRRIERAGVSAGSVVAFGPFELVLENLDQDDIELALALDCPAELRPWAASVSHETLSYSASCSAAPCSAGTRADLSLIFPPSHVPGITPAMTALYRRMATLARVDMPVLIVGETGVGKEGLVSILHASSRRCAGQLVTVNCAAIPAELFEAELFGIGKGVATGVDSRRGKIWSARGGTLFLDEIGEMPLTLQAKLLRVLQENEIQPLGGTTEAVDIRVVAATNADLEQRMEAGEFRRDLYYRLAGSILEPPPLRQRRGDIPALVEHFVRQFALEAGVRLRGVTVKAMGRWQAFDWPGNVRQLEHEVRRAVCQSADGGVIDAAMLPTPTKCSEDASTPGLVRNPKSQSPAEEAGAETGLDLEKHLRGLEEHLIREALSRTRGRQNHAAKLLGVSRNSLARRLEKLGIDYRTFR